MNIGRAERQENGMQIVLVVVVWCLLLTLSWPLALALLVLGLLALPFRLAGTWVAAALAMAKVLLFLPLRMLGHRGVGMRLME